MEYPRDRGRDGSRRPTRRSFTQHLSCLGLGQRLARLLQFGLCHHRGHLLPACESVGLGNGGEVLLVLLENLAAKQEPDRPHDQEGPHLPSIAPPGSVILVTSALAWARGNPCSGRQRKEAQRDKIARCTTGCIKGLFAAEKVPTLPLSTSCCGRGLARVVTSDAGTVSKAKESPGCARGEAAISADTAAQTRDRRKSTEESTSFSHEGPVAARSRGLWAAWTATEEGRGADRLMRMRIEKIERAMWILDAIGTQSLQPIESLCLLSGIGEEMFPHLRHAFQAPNQPTRCKHCNAQPAAHRYVPIDIFCQFKGISFLLIEERSECNEPYHLDRIPVPMRSQRFISAIGALSAASCSSSTAIASTSGVFASVATESVARAFPYTQARFRSAVPQADTSKPDTYHVPLGKCFLCASTSTRGMAWVDLLAGSQRGL